MTTTDTSASAEQTAPTPPSSKRSRAAAAPAPAPVAALQRRAIVFASEKGGVGKSLNAHALIVLLRERGARRVSAWDLDAGTGSLSAYFPSDDPLVGVGRDDITDQSTSRWINAIYDDAADDLVLDVPGGKTRFLYQTFAGGPAALLKAIAKAGRELVLVVPISDERDSLIGVNEAIDDFPTAKLVVLQNGRFGALKDFVLFNGRTLDDGSRKYGKMREKADAAGATSLYIPALPGETRAIISEEMISLADAPNAWATIGRRAAINAESWLEELESVYRGTPLDVAGYPARA